MDRPRSFAALAAPLAVALAAACAAAPVAPPPPAPPPVAAAPALPLLPDGDAARLDEAARLLANGDDLPMVARLLDGVAPGEPRRDLLAGQLAELTEDDEAAALAYGRYLALVDDDEVRLRRALALERVGRGDEVRADLERLRPPAREPAQAPAQPPPKRKLRPLLPSAR